MTSDITPISRDQFIATPHGEHDKFAMTFVAKADALGLWPLARGILNENRTVAAAIVVRYSKRTPTVANLQLLHTFGASRRRGLARTLVLDAWAQLKPHGVPYFRVSSEPDAAPFYRSLGFKFWGEQKSGCLLSISAVNGADSPEGSVYDRDDPVVFKALNSKQRGAIVKHFCYPH